MRLLLNKLSHYIYENKAHSQMDCSGSFPRVVRVVFYRLLDVEQRLRSQDGCSE